MLFVGNDWAEDHHDVVLQDVTGRVLARARLSEGIAGIARLHAMIGEHVDEHDEPAVVMVGIETDRGPLLICTRLALASTAVTRCRYTVPATLARTISPTSTFVGSTGATVTS